MDAGCGWGRFPIPASKIVGESGKVYAVDISEEAINALRGEIKRRNINNIETITGDITKRSPIDNESVGVVLMANILHGLKAGGKADNALREMYRVLKPGGIGSGVFLNPVTARMPPIVIRLAPEEVEELVGKHGFKRKGFFNIGKHRYAITFTKPSQSRNSVKPFTRRRTSCNNG